MKIAIIGLGLIGGSFARAFKKYTDHEVLVYDISKETEQKAIEDKNADGKLTSDFSDINLMILALYPEASIDFIKKRRKDIPSSTVVIDCGGTKAKICKEVSLISQEEGFVFIGGHPMAGIEKSGYEASMSGLFKGASMILTPLDADEKYVDFVKETLLPLGFSKFQISTPENHDRIIAFTSQLAHVVSSAYILSPTAESHPGFSAGSFRDMTRVARLNEYMWTELFLENRLFLKDEISLLIENLKKFRDAIETSNEKELLMMLRNGRIRKENSLLMEKKQ